LRISQIATKGNKVADETLSDSLIDGANYCILSRILIEEYGIEVDMSQEEVNHLMQKYRGNHDKGK